MKQLSRLGTGLTSESARERWLRTLLVAAILGLALLALTAAPAQAAPDYTISGTVTDQGTELPLVGVRVFARDVLGNDVNMATTGVGGTYAIDLPSGSYRLYTLNSLGYLDEWYDDVPVYNNSSGQGAVSIVLGTSNVPDRNFALARNRTISGTVTDSGTPGLPLGGCSSGPKTWRTMSFVALGPTQVATIPWTWPDFPPAPISCVQSATRSTWTSGTWMRPYMTTALVPPLPPWCSVRST
jgi:hypothetical protein